MTSTRFKDIKGAMSFLFQDKSLEGKDDWWQILGGGKGFNENRKAKINAPNLQVLNKTMSAFCPQTTKTGNLPHLSYVMRKPEPLSTEFKTLTAAYIGMYIYELKHLYIVCLIYIYIYFSHFYIF